VVQKLGLMSNITAKVAPNVFRDQFRVVGLRCMHFAVIFIIFILINTLIVDEYLPFEEV
jgi:hypothetical protein